MNFGTKVRYEFYFFGKFLHWKDLCCMNMKQKKIPFTNKNTALH